MSTSVCILRGKMSIGVFSHLLIMWFGFFFFFYWVIWIPYTFSTLIPDWLYGLQIFPLILQAAFHFVNCFFCCLTQSYLFIFCFGACTMSVIFKKSLQTPMSRSFSLFSSRSFTASGLTLTFKFLFHFELIFVSDVHEGPNFILLHLNTQFSQHYFLKTHMPDNFWLDVEHCKVYLAECLICLYS